MENNKITKKDRINWSVTIIATIITGILGIVGGRMSIDLSKTVNAYEQQKRNLEEKINTKDEKISELSKQVEDLSSNVASLKEGCNLSVENEKYIEDEIGDPYEIKGGMFKFASKIKGQEIYDVYRIKHSSYDCYAIWALEGKYYQLSFDLAHIDNTEKENNSTLVIYADGKILKEIVLDPNMEPTHYEINVLAVNDLKFVGKMNLRSGTYGMYNMKLSS